MALYTKDSIERVKEAVDMAELVGSRTDLRRVGSRFTGLCPFHEERTPSFSVNPDLKLYHCFGCDASGDAFRFVMETDGLDFREAVERLSERYGVELKLEREDPGEQERRQRRERLLKLLDRAADYYCRYLSEAAEAGMARAYLARRGLDPDTLREFRVGFAAAAGDRLVRLARSSGHSHEEIEAAGLASRGRDRFRGRITFPLCDARGRVLGFGARALHESERPKYLNTAENELFHKGRQLFGLHLARAAAARSRRVVVVEGYTDVLAVRQAGLAEVVAIMGTAMTPDQARELARLVGPEGVVLLALDADRSGQEATLRGARVARERGADVRVAVLPEGKDPADIVASEGLDAFAAVLAAAVSVEEFQLRRLLEAAELASATGRDRALASALAVVAQAPEGSALREELVRVVADRLALDPEYVHAQAASVGASAGDGRREPALAVAARPRPLAAVEHAERDFLAMCVARPDLGGDYLERLSDDHLTSPRLRRVRDHLHAHLAEPLAGLTGADAEVLAAVDEVVARAEGEDPSEALLELNFHQLELRRLDRALRRAEREGERGVQRDLLRERLEVTGRINAVMGSVA